MNTPQMVAETPAFRGGSGPSDPIEIEPEYLRDLAERLGVRSRLEVQDTQGEYNLCDTRGPSVSFLNLASVRALAESVGKEIDPRRFRMDMWLDDLEPFEELAWVDRFPGTREIKVGHCRFRVDDACERCLAIEANPDTGQRDMTLLKAINAMMTHRGYVSPHRRTPIVMGILAVPLNMGRIMPGDPISLVAQGGHV